MAKFDYRRQAYELAGPGYEKHVDRVVEMLHYNESIHMHDLGVEKKQHGACAYCWLRSGRAVRALVNAKLLTASAAQETSKAPEQVDDAEEFEREGDAIDAADRAQNPERFGWADPAVRAAVRQTVATTSAPVGAWDDNCADGGL